MAVETKKTEVLVLGSGPGGYTAAFRSADLGKKVILVEKDATLGGVCLNVGCIPSKALLHAAKVIEDAAAMAEFGVEFGKPKIDINKLRSWKDSVVKKLTAGLALLAKQRKVEVIQGKGKFTGKNELTVKMQKGEQIIQFEHAIIAAGSQPVRLPFLPDDPRIIDSTGALELKETKGDLLILGGGIIGMSCAYELARNSDARIVLFDKSNMAGGTRKRLVARWLWVRSTKRWGSKPGRTTCLDPLARPQSIRTVRP